MVDTEDITTMDAMQCLLERRSIRSFTDKEISKEDLEKIVKAGNYAPSAMNKNDRRFTIVRDPESIETLARAIRKKLNKDESYNFYKPKALIVCTAPILNRNVIEDCSVAMENMMLAAHSLGIGSVWINQFKGVCDDLTIRYALRAIEVPDSHIVGACAAFGYAADDADTSVEKKPSIVRWF